MNRLILTIVLVTFFCTGYAQVQDPVHWQFSSKKIGDKLYEVHFTAEIDAPWHIYSRDNNENLTQPTIFDFNKNPLLNVTGNAKEIGKLQKETVSETTVKYYEDQVDFVQIVKLKAAVKTTIAGRLNYMACTGGRCLPPVERRFSVSVGGE